GQTHARFTSPYQGDNSLRPDRERALSRLWTIYTGVKVPGHTELLLDIESAGGRGLSDALGLAGFTNLDVVRNPTLGSAPYIARAMVHVTVPLSREVIDVTPTAFSLAAHVPARRIEIRAGKLGGHANHANMGRYDAAMQGFLARHDPKADVIAYRQAGRVKAGFGLNTDYTFPRLVRVFARAGWNEGHNESFAYTEVNNSAQAGGDVSGASWNRSRDRLGIAVVSNGLSAPHREYLALGG